MTELRSRSTLPTLYSIVIVDLIGFGVVMPILPFYADSFGASATVLGGLLAIHAAFQFLFAPIWGRLSDRIGRRPVMLLTVLGTSAALLFLGLAPSLAWMFVARALSGAFAANISVATAYVADVTEPSERTRFMGLIGASFGIGFLLGPALGALLVGYGLAVPMYVAAGLAAINFVYAAIVLREPSRHAQPDAPSASRFAPLRDPAIARMCAINLAFSLAVTQLESIFAFLMLDRFGYDAAQVAWILVGMALVMALIQGGAMRPLSKRLGDLRLVRGGFILMAIGFAFVPSAYTVAILLAPLLLSAVGRAVAQPPMMGIVSNFAGERERGHVMGTFQSAASLARIAGPMLAGALYDYRIAYPFYLASLLILVAMALSRGVVVDLDSSDPKAEQATSN